MNLLLCLKQVPKDENISFDQNGNMLREACDCALNILDEYALENALLIKKLLPAVKITALSMGPAKAEEVLRYALAKGADEAFLLTDEKLRGADSLITALALSKAAKKISQIKKESFDLIICGAKSSDGETSHVPSQLAEFQKMPEIVFAKKILKIDELSITVQIDKEGLSSAVKSKFPCLISFEADHSLEIKMPSIINKIKAKNALINILNAQDIGQESAAEESPTWVGKLFEKKSDFTPKQGREISAEELAELLKNKKIRET